MNRWLCLAAILAMLAFSSCGSASTRSPVSKSTPSPATDTSTWWQINLSDNETFYGHLRGVTASDIDLVNVYYVQASQHVVEGLVANQIQCPTDEVVINRDVVTSKTTIQATSQLASKLDNLVVKPESCFQPASP